MALSLATVGGKITATFINLIIAQVNKQGTTSIIPISVAGTGVSVGAAGKVSFSASTTVSVNGCFTSDYTNYLILFDFTTSAVAALNIVLRLSGTNATTAYDSQRVNFQNATVTASQSLNAASWVGSGGLGDIAARHTGSLTLYSPAVAAATGGLIHNGITMNPMTTSAAIYDGFLQHRTTTAYDGFNFTPGSGNITGSLWVYGYNAN